MVWLGVPTEQYEQTVHFFEQILGLDVAFRETTTVELAAENGDKVQIFGPGNGYFGFFSGQHAQLVPLFEVDSLDDACLRLAPFEAKVVGEKESDPNWSWFYVRGPDGNLYALAERHR